MGTAWTMAVTPDRNTDLITDGPFARVRHPIYGFSLLLMACTVVVVATARRCSSSAWSTWC